MGKKSLRREERTAAAKKREAERWPLAVARYEQRRSRAVEQETVILKRDEERYSARLDEMRERSAPMELIASERAAALAEHDPRRTPSPARGRGLRAASLIMALALIGGCAGGGERG